MRCSCAGGDLVSLYDVWAFAPPKMISQAKSGINMLRSYSAELHGSNLVWLEQPPPDIKRIRVLVVVEETAGSGIGESKPAGYNFTGLAGRLQWSGDAVAAQRESRDVW